MIQVQFDLKQLQTAFHFGQIRQEASKGLKDNWGMRRGSPAEEAQRDVVGILGEWAVANFFGQPYEFTLNTFKAPDVVVNGHGIQVKSSLKAESLTIRRDAKDDEPYVLTLVTMPNLDPFKWHTLDRANAWVGLVGWMYPWQARLMAECDPSLWRDPGKRNSPAIFIPRAELFTMDKLKEIVYNDASSGVR
jgi:hypothetical protein